MVLPANLATLAPLPAPPVPCGMDRHVGPFEPVEELAELSGHGLVLLPVVPRHGHAQQRPRRARGGVTLPYASGYHAPVMVRECMDLLQPERGGTFLDGTLGGGGHAEALLERGPDARSSTAWTATPTRWRRRGTRLARFGDRFRPVKSNFADALETAGIADGTLDGVLLDLGISSHQIDVDARGFTFRPGAPLDMRMGQASADEPTAADLLNTLDEGELADVFYRYGEERRSRKLARIVAEMREAEPFATSDQLQRAIDRALGAAHGDRRTARASSRRCASP